MSSGRITLEEALDACDSAGMIREPVTASEIAAELGCTRRTALNKLDELADRGDIESKKVGARSRVWWRPPDGGSARDRGDIDSALDTDDAYDPDDASGAGSGTVDGPRSAVRKRLGSELEEVFGRISDGFYALDDRWRFTYVSERAEELIDARGANLVGETIWDVFEDVVDTKLSEEYRTAMETQEPTSFEFYDELLDAWYGVHAYPSETGLSVYFRDVTERKQRERQLEESERRYRTLVEHFPNGAVALVDEDLRYRTVGGSPIVASTTDDLESQPVGEVLPSALAADLLPRYEAAFEGERSTFEYEVDDRIYQIHIVPVQDDGGDIFAALGMSQDVTESKERERELDETITELRESEERLKLALKAGEMGTWELDLQTGGSPLRSQQHDRIFGYEEPLDDWDFETFLDHVHPDDRERVERRFEGAFQAGKWEFECRVAGADGEQRAISVQGEFNYDDEGEPTRAVGVVQDVSERKERERELERALDLLERTERIADVGGWEIDVDTRDVFWTDHIFDLLEVTADEEPVLDEALDMYYEEDQPLVEDAIEEALASGDPFDVEVRIRTDGGETRWLRLQGVPETVDDEVASFRGAAQDITEQVERERQLEETVEKLEESNDRLESFASMLAHELRNPVAIGQIYSQRLPAETNPEAVEYVTEAFDRIEDMIEVLLMLTRGREAIGERTPVQLADAARGAWDKVDAPDATLEVESDRTIQADETYVQHLLRNLFENAVEHGSTSNQPSADDAEHGGADVTITVGGLPSVSASGASGGSTDEPVGGFYVADDGSGIPPEERDAVFEAGYTTAAEQGGTGLGLAFVQKLADVYEWECTVSESESGGARFEFTNVGGGA